MVNGPEFLTIMKGLIQRYKRWNRVHPTYGAFWGMGVGIGCGVGWGPGFGPEAIGYVGAGCGIGFSVGFTLAGLGVGLPTNILFEAPYNAIMATRGFVLELARSNVVSRKHFAGDGWTGIVPQVSELQGEASEKLSSFRQQHLSSKGIDFFDLKKNLPLFTTSACESFRAFHTQLFCSRRELSGMSIASTASSTATLSSGVKANDVVFNHAISVKLDDKYSLLWRQQILAAIKGHDLHKYIVGASAVPPQFATTEDETRGNISSEFLAWERQDQLLLSWLLSSMSESMLTRLVGCTQSYQVWNQIQEFFESHTRAKIQQYKSQLRNTSKGTCTITEYLLRIKAFVDALALIGNPISDNEHVDIILEGLPEEYDTFVTLVNTQKNPYSVSEIESLLLTQEIQIEKNVKAATTQEDLSSI